MLHTVRAFLCATLFLFFLHNNALAEERPIRVGVTLPLTGAFSEYGAAMKNALQLVQEEHPEVKSTLQFFIEDDRYLPKQTMSALNKLLTVDKVDLLYIWGNEPALAVAPVAQRRRVPTIVMAQHPKAGAGYSYVIRFLNPAADYSQKMLEYLRAHGAKNIAVVKVEISHSNILIDALKAKMLPGESFSLIDSYSPQESDFRVAIMRLKKRKFDAVGIYLLPTQLVQFFRQAAELNYQPPMPFGTTPFETNGLVEQTNGLINGAVYTHNTLSEAFRTRYIEKFGNDSQIAYAANIYDFAVLTAELFAKRKNTPSAEEILAAYRNAGERSGITGNFHFKKSTQSGQYFEFPVVAKKISGGKIVVLED